MTRRPRYWNEDSQSWEDSAPAPAGPGAARRRVLWWTAAAAAVLAVALVPVFSQAGGDDSGDRADSRPKRTATPARTPTPSPSSAAPACPDLPAGYEAVRENGFGFAVPEGWEADTTADSGVLPGYESSDGNRFLRVSELSGSDIGTSFDGLSTGWSDFQVLADPRPVDESDSTAYLVDYSLSSDGIAWSVAEIHFRARGGTLYSVAAFTKEDPDLTDEESLAQTVAAYFHPPGDTACA
ncbi:hypothetical protein [Streptomyces murinus]|uniref:Uncharacterized protein n=1 Tax=Streptomyces murinus TaxID=33900 RepID=A0A7W3NNL5_STRMR|nr:hypothetical protein [Streptomyces murinus]MBA9053798.1 hypothetical protein [Streptomyces murinus]UWW94886.1 hypothetical protein GO605_31640 [Streptomyces murinus]